MADRKVPRDDGKRNRLRRFRNRLSPLLLCLRLFEVSPEKVLLRQGILPHWWQV